MARRSLLRTAPVEPIDVHGTRVLAVGTVLWAIALIGTLVARDSLAETGNDWWIWTCLTGVLFGLVGVGYFARRERRANRTRRPAGESGADAPDTDAPDADGPNAG